MYKGSSRLCMDPGFAQDNPWITRFARNIYMYMYTSTCMANKNGTKNAGTVL